MKKQILVVGISFLFSLMVALLSPLNSPQINQLYVFGDSLSDVGNVFRATGGKYPTSPPYFQGRFANGPIWVEYLADRLALTDERSTNYACGGATTGSGSINGIPGLLGQVYNFTKTHQRANPQALYVIWAGANDYLYGAANTPTPVENLSKAIQSLTQVGAKKILVANLPDLGKLPATRNAGNSQRLSSITSAHNLGLAESVNLLQQKLAPDTEIHVFDVNALYREAITNPGKFGFNNVTDPCLKNLTICEHPDQFLFWDGIHPTNAGHRLLALFAGNMVVSKPLAV